MNPVKIFVIDDESNILQLVKTALEAEHFSVQTFDDPIKAIGIIAKEQPSLVITDLRMPQLDGLKAIERIKAILPEVNILVMTAFASVETAVGAIRAGASDYLVKPFKIDELLKAIKKSLSQTRLPAEEKGLQTRYQIKNLIGQSARMQEIFSLIERVAKTDSSVLIIGESGTGKEMAARAIHYHSKRRKGPFVSVNCAALPENLLESELFGYEKGAFTGAVAAKMGLFELAEGGTFLLDEVGEMSLNLQVKLLRVLQERVVKHLGGVKDIPVDFRLIAATSKNLPEEIKTGQFREDLFYRLNVIPIVTPPLREHAEDIPLFVYYFLGFYADKHRVGRKFKVNPAAMALFEQHSWPGNVRELENVIERLVSLAESDEIDEKIVKNSIQSGLFSSKGEAPIHKTGDLNEALEDYEKNLIQKALVETRGNKNQAAKKLNLTRQALHYKLQKYQIEAKDND